ncbi:MAG: EamA family transporter [Chloroflexota bacterium]
MSKHQPTRESTAIQTSPPIPDSTSLVESPSRWPWIGFLYLSIVYLVWGATYLAIRVAVQEGSGFPPFTMGAMRMMAASGILFLWSGLAGKRIKPSWQELLILSGSGLAMWLGGNGLVIWAEQRADSNLAALIIAATPIWVAMMEAIIDRKPPSIYLIGALIIGFAGIVVLSLPVLTSGLRADLGSVIALLLAALSWGLGLVLQSRKKVALSPIASSAIQHLAGGLGFFVVMWLMGEPLPTPIPQAWAAWGFLVVFGSVFAFTSLVRVLQILPTNIVMTYSYVNPVIAVFLGWLILDEKITLWTIGGAALVLIGVAGVFRERYGHEQGG